MNNNSDPVQKFFLRGGWGGQGPQLNLSKFLESSETSRARKIIFGLLVDIDNANSHM